jgi:hypothetical protein
VSFYRKANVPSRKLLGRTLNGGGSARNLSMEIGKMNKTMKMDNFLPYKMKLKEDKENC